MDLKLEGVLKELGTLGRVTLESWVIDKMRMAVAWRCTLEIEDGGSRLEIGEEGPTAWKAAVEVWDIARRLKQGPGPA